jgi:hypothetical protein
MSQLWNSISFIQVALKKSHFQRYKLIVYHYIMHWKHHLWRDPVLIKPISNSQLFGVFFIEEGKILQVILWKLLQFLSFFVEICTKNSPSYIAFSKNFCAEKLYSSTSFLFLAQYFF